MNIRSDEKLGTERMLPLVFKMAMPAVAAQLVNLLYGVVDKIYIGQIEGVGGQALAGIGITTSVILLISAFSSLVGGGGSPLAAIQLGRGNREEAARILANGFVMLLCSLPLPFPTYQTPIPVSTSSFAKAYYLYSQHFFFAFNSEQ